MNKKRVSDDMPDLYYEAKDLREYLISGGPLEEILMKCQSLAKVLHDNEMEEWITFEITGSEKGDYYGYDPVEQERLSKMASYRSVSASFAVSYFKDKAYRSFDYVMGEFLRALDKYYCILPIRLIENELKSKKMGIVLAGRQMDRFVDYMISSISMDRYDLTNFKTNYSYVDKLIVEIESTALEKIIGSVRTRILSFLNNVTARFRPTAKDQEHVIDKPRETITEKHKPSIFICHSSKDGSFVQKLDSDLKNSNMETFYAEIDVLVGEPIPGIIPSVIEGYDFFSIILSPNSVRSEWVKKELNLALIKELEKKYVFILPILIEDCNIPPSIKEKKYADFRKGKYDRGFKQLTNAIRQHMKKRVK